LTPLQGDLLRAFFEREQRLFLTGGAALAGFYFGHRATEALDLFSGQSLDLEEIARVLEEAAAACGATLRSIRTYPGFRRFLASRPSESCVVDLVLDRAPSLETEKIAFGQVRVDTLREIAANKLCALLGRSEIKDLVDFKFLSESGLDLRKALEDAERKDAGMDPATLAWVLEQVTISAAAPIPGGIDPGEIDGFRRSLVRELRALAFTRVRSR
jgi:predicted nucleotidyltransferase component of viral defense system